jgi:alpha-N-arabinofuranosidase
MQQWVEYMNFDGKSPMANLRRENGQDKAWGIKYFGVGNESWGCGGNMRPEYYSDEYRRYATYVRNYGNNKIFKIACGPNADDYNWTEVLMREAGRFMDGLTLHYYTVPLTWEKKGSATDFNEEEWFSTLKKTLTMEELVSKHSTIMDKYDPEKRIGLIVDEWGTWYDVEPGTNPGFLYQQNTLRDALIAGINLNIFNNHSDRVKMANIAQLVNVLQSVILTEGEDIVLTPTYHVFNMYKVHQDAMLLDCQFESPEYKFGDEKIPQLSVSSSIDSQGKINISICNLSHESNAPIDIDLRGVQKAKVSGMILTANEINEMNTFDDKDNVVPVAFKGAKIVDNHVIADIPSKSVVTLELS